MFPAASVTVAETYSLVVVAAPRAAEKSRPAAPVRGDSGRLEVRLALTVPTRVQGGGGVEVDGVCGVRRGGQDPAGSGRGAGASTKVITGKFWYRFGPLCPLLSFAVTPSPPRSMPSPPFE